MPSPSPFPVLGVLGLSRSGEGAARLASHLGYHVWLSDAGENTPEKEALAEALHALPNVRIETNGHSEAWFTSVQHVIVSPGIPPHAPLLQRLHQQGITTETDVSFALRHSPADLRWVGITGSNGKSTVTQLLTHLLTQLGCPAVACGNVGVSVAKVMLNLLQSSLQPTALPVLVMELSSYQLHHSPTLATSEGGGAEVAIFTNLTPDHLQWHGSYDAYAQAKQRLFFNTPAPKVALLNQQDAQGQAWLQQLSHVGQNVQGFGQSLNPTAPFPQWIVGETQIHYHANADAPSMMLAELAHWPLLGSHNRENLVACIAAVAALGVYPLKRQPTPAEQARLHRAMACFGGVEHRLEPVSHPWGIRCFNDSKATNPEAAMTALHAVHGYPAVVCLAGGLDKETPLEAWASLMKTTCHHVVLYGRCAERFYHALLVAGFDAQQLVCVSTLTEAYQQALVWFKEQHTPEALATGRHVLLLSPAAASQDQFADFEERGRHFKALVEKTSLLS